MFCMELFRTEEKLQLILVNQKFLQKEGARSYFVVLSSEKYWEYAYCHCERT
ncbi:hypothetical protein BACI71_30752 [Bacillus mycoides]|uniref:Uncharacterized protein n=1 Tax=Bacillus mycoides TaxID=1405 RepID=A0A653Y727_BACMY|nr:hypothetical protein BACI71_30752 [Bacillus mycoides]